MTYKLLGTIPVSDYNSTINLSILEKLVNDVPFAKENDNVRYPFLDETKKEIFKRDSNRCQMCWNRDVVLHHINPHGPATKENGVTLCTMCHYIVHLYLRFIKGYIGIPNWDPRFDIVNNAILVHLCVIGKHLEDSRKEVDIIKKQQEDNKA